MLQQSRRRTRQCFGVRREAGGSEAPRRFGFCIRGAHEDDVSTTVGRRATAPSSLRSAGAVQKRRTCWRRRCYNRAVGERASVLECGGKLGEAKRHAALDSAYENGRASCRAGGT